VVASGRPADGEGVVEAGDDGGDGVGLQRGDSMGPVLLAVAQAQLSDLPRPPTQTDINQQRVHIAAVRAVALGRERERERERTCRRGPWWREVAAPWRCNTELGSPRP
jgi:hypothetical protein